VNDWQRWSCLSIALSAVGCSAPVQPANGHTNHAETFAQPGCCDLFEQKIAKWLPDNQQQATLEAKINWLAQNKPAEAAQLGDLALEQIKAREVGMADFDVITLGGGPASMAVGCNLVNNNAQPSCGRKPTRNLIISKHLGGPFFAFGNAFYLNTPEVPLEETSMNLLHGCPIQLAQFVQYQPDSDSYVTNNAFGVLLNEKTQLFAKAKLLGDVIVLNHMLSGTYFVGESVEPAQVTLLKDDSQSLVQVQLLEQSIRARALVIATGHGSPIIPPGIQAVYDSEHQGNTDPLVETIDDFLTRVHTSPGTDFTKLEYYANQAIGIGGNKDGASTLMDFFLGAAPREAYGNLAKLPTNRPQPPEGLQIYQFGQTATTGAAFKEKLKPYKALRYQTVAQAIDDGKVKTFADKVDAADIVNTNTDEPEARQLEVTYGTNKQRLNRLLLANGYDANGAYSFLSTAECASPTYKPLEAAGTRVAEVPYCGETRLAGVYVFTPAALSPYDRDARSLRNFSPRAVQLVKELTSELFSGR